MSVKLNIQAMRKIGRRIRLLRKGLHLTQEKLAEISGYSPGYIGSIEKARKVPSMTFLFDVAYALQTSPSELLVDFDGGPDRESIKLEIKDLVDQL
ncbi:MAG TPA: helix-turn-helix transcriptional regulator [Acidobacteriota bacterium]|nr:helix-turn-helix transcriptional regulator [Acidobacteriota bacterium]